MKETVNVEGGAGPSLDRLRYNTKERYSGCATRWAVFSRVRVSSAPPQMLPAHWLEPKIAPRDLAGSCGVQFCDGQPIDAEPGRRAATAGDTQRYAGLA